MVGKKVKKALHNPETATIILLVIMVVFVASLQSNFFYSATVKNNIVSWTPLILLAMGQAFVIIAGGLDLSCGPAMSLMLCVLTATMKADNPASGWKALLFGLITALIVGVVNGVVVGYLRVPALIATFATSYIWLGLALFIMPTPGGECVSWMRVFYNFGSVENAPEFLKSVGKILPTSFFLIVLGVIIWIVISRTKFGRYMYAVGSDRDIAYQSGINSSKIQMCTYIINALFIYACALFYAAQNQSGSARIGDALTLQAIAAVVVGGIALSGGSGKVYMAIVGALIMSLVNKLIYQLGIQSEYQVLVSGVIIIVAISTSVIYSMANEKFVVKGSE